jgi:glycosyltransferase involved in cell wall biosynthesis
VTEVHQFLSTFAGRDAIGMHTLRLRKLLRDAGYASDIYAVDTHDDVRNQALPASAFPAQLRGRDDVWILYHFSIGNPLFEQVRELDVGLALDYHNITDAKYFWRWEPRAATTMLEGRRQLAVAAPAVKFALADSAFNERELVELGCKHTAVAPILIDFADFDGPPDAALLAERQRVRAAGGSDWLSVGRIAPNKCQHDVLLAFAVYRRIHDPRARLTFVGGQSAGLYWKALHTLAVDLGVADAVTFSDVVTHEQLLAYYRSADVFVLLSEHEGFNVPVLEAMHFDVPVIAYASSALPGTVGDGGLLLTDKRPVVVAAAADRLRSDASLRQGLVDAGRARVDHFSIARTGPQLLDTLARLMKETGS